MNNLAYVIGDPVEQSKSPMLFTKLFDHINKEACSFLAAPIKKEELAGFCNMVRSNGEVKGFNITLPHKHDIMHFLDEIDSNALSIGAVNAVLKKDGKLIGYNTDYIGITQALMARANSFDDFNATVIGAGGAAKAVIKALVDLGCKRVNIVNRTVEKAEEISNIYKNAKALPISELNGAVEDSDIVINSTSRPITELYKGDFKKNAIVADLVYYVEQSHNNMHEVELIDGLEILIRQAIPCAKMWFDVDIRAEDWQDIING